MAKLKVYPKQSLSSPCRFDALEQGELFVISHNGGQPGRKVFIKLENRICNIPGSRVYTENSAAVLSTGRVHIIKSFRSVLPVDASLQYKIEAE